MRSPPAPHLRRAGAPTMARRGMAIIWVSVSMLVMIALVGIAIDTGYAVLVGNQLQNAADAAALAGARTVVVSSTTARSAAATIGSSNKVGATNLAVDPDADVSIGNFNTGSLTFTAGGSPTNAVRVTARRTSSSGSGSVPLFFGSAFGSPTMDMTRTAIAMCQSTMIPSLVVLDPTGSAALDIGGTASLSAPAGGIQVNSSAPDAASFGGSAQSSAQFLNVTGGVSGPGHFTGTINRGSPPIPDPYASLPEPAYTPTTMPDPRVSNGGNIVLTPGHYSGITNKGTIHLTQGIYVIDSGGLNLNAHGAIDCIVGGAPQGVMIFLVNGGVLNLQGNNVALNLTAPDPTRDSFTDADIYSGISIFQSRSNTATDSLPLSGSVTVSGVIYIPTAELDVTASGNQTGAKLIVFRLQMRGSGNVQLVAPSGVVNSGRPFLVN